ncbi:peroxidase mlt-7-like [Montipora foliosa]|uniref:peroxidase mlt-7-like n=1 Tax=Montipora foliosa TaxID=591990 RepID=UPI0035F14275
MARRWLCTLALLLVLEMISTYTIETSDSNKAGRLEEIKAMDELDSLLAKKHPRGSLSSKFHKVVKEKQEDTLKPKPKHQDEEDGDPETISRYEKRLSILKQINIHENVAEIEELKAIAESLVPNCTVKVTRKKEEKLAFAINSHYQDLQHFGEGAIIADEEFSEAISNELCAVCVLDKMCVREDVLNITDMLPVSDLLEDLSEEELCRTAIILVNKKLLAKKPGPHIKCDKTAEFRTIDGTCNNLDNPLFGAAHTPFGRLILPDYGDGISSLRLADNGEELPNARQTSFQIHGSNADGTNPDSSLLSVFFMNFGQYMDHDISLALAEAINCEPPEGDENPECMNIEIPEDDEVFRARNITFIELERDAPVERKECQLVPREQINIITTYIDASNVYGSSEAISNAVRDSGGLLKVTKHPQDCKVQDLLPPVEDNNGCPFVDPFRPCFLTGDIRNNENAGLNTVHTVFMRRHNVIARFLGQMTDFDAETIFQVARKILGAQQQYIMYNEFLPLILSQETIDKFDLRLGKGFNYSTCYKKNLDPAVSTAFSVAAYRFGHTLVPELFSRLNQDFFETHCEHCHDRKNFLQIPVRDFGNPHYLYDLGNGGTDAIMRGLMKDAAGALDGRFSSSVQEQLIRGPGDMSDLVAINTQRSYGRGLPGYTAFREFCGLRPVNNFRQLVTRAGFTDESRRNLRRLFDSVHDIPLFSGGLLEPRDENGGLMGPTFQCILGEQFKRLKCGDRFWHENEPSSALHTEFTALTPCQLKEIRNTLISKIICEVSDDISAVNRFAFQQTGIRTPCDKLPEVNLEPWMPDFKCEEEPYGW